MASSTLEMSTWFLQALFSQATPHKQILLADRHVATPTSITTDLLTSSTLRVFTAPLRRFRLP